MKRCFPFLAAFFLLLSAVPVFAAGTVTQSLQHVSSNVFCLTFSFTADSSDGTVPATISTSAIDGYVFLVNTNPGATAPTDNYDITLTDSDGIDISGGELANRSTSNSESALMSVDSTVAPLGRFVQGHITLNLTNNSVNSAVGTVKVYYRK